MRFSKRSVRASHHIFYALLVMLSRNLSLTETNPAPYFARCVCMPVFEKGINLEFIECIKTIITCLQVKFCFHVINNVLQHIIYISWCNRCPAMLLSSGQLSMYCSHSCFHFIRCSGLESSYQNFMDQTNADETAKSARQIISSSSFISSLNYNYFSSGGVHIWRPQHFRDFGPPPPLSAFGTDLQY